MNLKALSWIWVVGALAVGCHAALSLDDLELVDGTTSIGGSGGSGTGTPTGSGGAATGTPTGSGGGSTCVVSECPFVDNGCQTPICTDEDVCGVDFAAEGADCEDAQHPLATLCRNDGECVECLVRDDCQTGFICRDRYQCTLPQCDNDQLDPGETDVDCGDLCPPCANGDDCAVADDCLSGLCQGQTCAACTDHDQCEGAEWCDPGINSGTCTADKVDGELCGSGGECISTHCFQRNEGAVGVCCNEACDGPCKTCVEAHGAPALGTCGNVVANDDPYGECPGGVLCRGVNCDGTGACNVLTNDQPCGDSTCSSDTVMTGDFCDNNGDCGQGRSLSCVTGHRCVVATGRCNDDCADNHANCLVGYFCDTDGSCQPLRNQGAPCPFDAACDTGFCSQGVCCNDACTADCYSCIKDETGLSDDGWCGAVQDGIFPVRDDCTGYACLTAGACSNSCSDHTECHPDYFCEYNTCQPKRAQGQRCTEEAKCQAGLSCTDGVCCNERCGELCEACEQRRTGVASGTCAPVEGGTDPDGDCGDNCCDGAATPACDGSGACTDPGTASCAASAPTAADCTSAPAICSRCEMNGSRAVCVLDCYADPNLCRDQDVVCPKDYDCEVNCSDPSGGDDAGVPDACFGTRLLCPEDKSCVVNCETGVTSCHETLVICPIQGVCEVHCGASGECLGAEVLCGHRSCIAECNGNGSPPPSVYCPQYPPTACPCDLICN